MEERLGISSGEQDIRFNLMAVVPDRRIAITHKLKMLRTNKAIVTAALEKLITAKSPHLSGTVSSIDVKKETTDDLKKNIKPFDDRDSDSIKKENDISTAEVTVVTKTETKDSPEINILQRLSLQSDSMVVLDDNNFFLVFRKSWIH